MRVIIITKFFDDNARNNIIHNINIKDYNVSSIDLKEVEIRLIEAKIARKYIATFHYSKTMPDSTKYSYGAFVGEKIIGVICYGMGTSKNQYLSIIPTIQNGEYLELTRVWCMHNSPKNLESMFISKTLKMLPKEIKLIISFADSSKEHCGIIYQATNWYYLGKNKGGKMMITEDGIEKHPRLIGIYRKRHPELKDVSTDDIMNMYNWRYIQGGDKHRYIYLRYDKKKKKEVYEKYIKDRELPYPKCTKTTFSTDSDIIIYEKNKKYTKDGIDVENIIKFIISKVRNESNNGFQYIIDKRDIEYEFDLIINNDMLKDIEINLNYNNEVCNVEIENDEIDVCLYIKE